MGWELEAKQWWSMGWMRVFYDWRQISFALKTFADFSNASVAAQWEKQLMLCSLKVPCGPSFLSKNIIFLAMLLISIISSDIKGQVISKCIFGIFSSSKKWRKIGLIYYGTSSRIDFLHFWEDWKHQKDIPKLTDLQKYQALKTHKIHL